MPNIDQYAPGQYAVQQPDGSWQDFGADQGAAERNYNDLAGLPNVQQRPAPAIPTGGFTIGGGSQFLPPAIDAAQAAAQQAYLRDRLNRLEIPMSVAERENLIAKLTGYYGGTAGGGTMSEDEALDFIWRAKPDLAGFYRSNGWNVDTVDQQRAAVRNWISSVDPSHRGKTPQQVATELGAPADGGGATGARTPTLEREQWETAQTGLFSGQPTMAAKQQQFAQELATKQFGSAEEARKFGQELATKQFGASEASRLFGEQMAEKQFANQQTQWWTAQSGYIPSAPGGGGPPSGGDGGPSWGPPSTPGGEPTWRQGNDPSKMYVQGADSPNQPMIGIPGGGTRWVGTPGAEPYRPGRVPTAGAGSPPGYMPTLEREKWLANEAARRREFEAGQRQFYTGALLSKTGPRDYGLYQALQGPGAFGEMKGSPSWEGAAVDFWRSGQSEPTAQQATNWWRPQGGGGQTAGFAQAKDVTPQQWNSWSPSRREMELGRVSAAGIDLNDWERQRQAAAPTGQAAQYTWWR